MILNKLIRCRDCIAKVFNVVLTFMSIMMFLSLCAIVFCRYALKTDLFGIDEIILTVVVWMYFLGAAMGSYTDNHIKADVINSFVKNPYVLFFVEFLNRIVTIALIGVMVYCGYEFMRFAIDYGGATVVLKIPRYINYPSVFAGSVMMFFFELINFIIFCFDIKPRWQAIRAGEYKARAGESKCEVIK